MSDPTADAGIQHADASLQKIESEFAVVTGREGDVRAACATLRTLLESPSVSATRADSYYNRLLSLLHKHLGPLARVVFDFLEAEAERIPDPSHLLSRLLEARDHSLQRCAVELLFRLTKEGRLTPTLALVERIAFLADRENSPLRDADLLTKTKDFLRALPDTDSRTTPDDAIEALLATREPSIRSLAARLLDLDETPPSKTAAERILGPQAAEELAPLLAFTRASHRDLVEITSDPGSAPPMLPSLREAEKVLGRTLLGIVIGQLGWSRFACGLTVDRRIGVSVEGSLPFVVRPIEETLFDECGRTNRLWEAFIIIAHGGSSQQSRENGIDEATIQQFRRYNLSHAVALTLMLEPVPLTVSRVRQTLEATDPIVEGYLALFSAYEEDAEFLPDLYSSLRGKIEDSVTGMDEDSAASPETSRLVQTFEDPRSLREVTSLHGLKRYLHQRGLRLAFRLFRSSRSTNRTVDLILASQERIVQTIQRIRYIDFEPSSPESLDLPLPVTLAVDAYARQLLHRAQEVPDIEILAYGNEVQVYVQFRNHPVFLRIDLSPPLQGGMIDLEYFGVSQYEVDQHPDLLLQGIRRFFRRLEFDVAADDLHLHARYDKERAFDLGDLMEKAKTIFRLLPYLMDIDWMLGGLDYPQPARLAVANAWVDYLIGWGVLPINELLTEDRRKVLLRLIDDPAGVRETAWDGRSDYRDRFTGTPPRDLFERIRKTLQSAGLAQLGRWEREGETLPAQLPLERVVIDPLRRAIQRGEVIEIAERLAPASSDDFEREHEVERFARMLAGDGSPLPSAGWTAQLVGTIERHLRFRTTGSIHGHPVQHATLHLRNGRVGIYVLRDATGATRLALAAWGEVLYRTRTGSAESRDIGPELDHVELARLLRANNYLTDAYDGSLTDPSTTTADLRALFRTPNPNAPPHPAPGDRIIPGVVASPGSATGFVRFNAAGRSPSDFEGAVFVAPTIRPEDAPFLRQSAAVVSTGGGILSHAGLTALELQKPAVIISGRWQQDSDGSIRLVYRRPEFREEEERFGDYHVALRREMREVEEVLEEGDLVVVDAEAGVVSNLGQDRDALALHAGLSLLERAEQHLSETKDATGILAERGHLLRAVHQLEKLVSRIDRPLLVRFAVRELLRSRPLSVTGRDRGARAGIVRSLCRGARVGTIARDALQRQFEGLQGRCEAYTSEASNAVPAADNPFEVCFLRLRAMRAQRLIHEVESIAQACEVTVTPLETRVDLDGSTGERLESMRCELMASSREAIGGSPEDWRLRHLLRQIAWLDLLLTPSTRTSDAEQIATFRSQLNRSTEAQLSTLARKWVIDSESGGAELSPLIGPKAANLGEISRVLGHNHVPPWFALTAEAFRETLKAVPRKTRTAAGADPSRGLTLGEAIERVLAHRDMDVATKAASIRLLWQMTSLPQPLTDEILHASRRAGREDVQMEAEPVPHDDAFVAIRSSGLEEDSEDAAWAGQFDTFLFIRGEVSLLEHLKQAWAGLWTERAIHGRAARGVPAMTGGGGLIVQRMLRSRLSGVVHTASIATGQIREMVINVGLGMGEGIVAGIVDVDQITISKEDIASDPLRYRYRVGDKREQVVFDEQSGQGTRITETLYHQRLRPALEYAELCELVKAAKTLETVYGCPLDIEFAYEAHELQILQVRPIPLFHSALQDTWRNYPLVIRPTEAETEMQS